MLITFLLTFIKLKKSELKNFVIYKILLKYFSSYNKIMKELFFEKNFNLSDSQLEKFESYYNIIFIKNQHSTSILSYH